MERLAAPPTRSNGHFTLGFGLIVIPLSVFTGQGETRVTRKEFFADTDASVGRVMVRKDTGEVIEWAQVQRRATATNGATVELTDAEMVEATMPKGQFTIVARMPAKDMGNYLLTEVRQVRPQAVKGKVDPSVARAWALLAATLKSAKQVLVINGALRGPAQYYVLTHDGDLFTIAPADSIREPLDQVEAVLSADEKRLAKMLLDSIPVGTPTVVDDTAEAIQAYVDNKAKGIKPPTPTTQAGSPDDLAAALLASVEESKAAAAKKSKGSRSAA